MRLISFWVKAMNAAMKAVIVPIAVTIGSTFGTAIKRVKNALPGTHRLPPWSRDQVVMEHEDRSLVGRQTPESPIQAIPIDDSGRRVQRAGEVDWKHPHVGQRRPRSASR